MDTLIPTERPAIIQSALDTGCQQLDFRVRLQTCIGYVVTHTSWSKTLGRKMPHAETFLKFSEAMAFCDEQGDDAGKIIALREDGSVIGEVPTPGQERAIRERAALREADLQADLSIVGLRNRWRGNGGL